MSEESIERNAPRAMMLTVDRSDLVLLVTVASVLSAMALGGTGLYFSYLYSGQASTVSSPTWKMLTAFNLATEDNVAVWFSSMLLLANACLATVCFTLDRQDRPSWLNFGWLVIAIGFIALSFDELGSLHERLVLPAGLLGDLMWYAPIVIFLPVYMLLFGWLRMRSSGVGFLLIMCGAACFASIPIQEYFELEKFRDGGPTWERPIVEILLEEGAELAGMLCFLMAFSIYALDRSGPEMSDRVTRLRIEFDPRRGALLASVLVILSLAGVQLSATYLPADEIKGTAQHWFPAALAFLAGLLVRHADGRERLAHQLASLATAAASWAVSAYVGSNLHTWHSFYIRFGILVAIVFALGARLAAYRARCEVLPMLVWGGLVLVALIDSLRDGVPMLLLLASFALLVMPLMSRLAHR